MLKEYKIFTGIGVGQIKFGCTSNVLLDCLGEPNQIESEKFSDSHQQIYVYRELGINFSFSSEEQNRLTSIEVEKKGFEIEGLDLIGSSLNEVLQDLESLEFSTPKIDSISNEIVNNHLMLYYDEESIIISFIDYMCDSFSVAPLWKNDEEYLFPS